MKKNLMTSVALIILGAAGAWLYLNLGRPDKPALPDGREAFCVKHQIAESRCPWCHSNLIEKLGMCPGHGVPEALCSRCNPALIPGFKAENDWCAGHGLPESQCQICRGGQHAPGQAPCSVKEGKS